jgi:hypothetical protein
MICEVGALRGLRDPGRRRPGRSNSILNSRWPEVESSSNTFRPGTAPAPDLRRVSMAPDNFV